MGRASVECAGRRHTPARRGARRGRPNPIVGIRVCTGVCVYARFTFQSCCPLVLSPAHGCHPGSHSAPDVDRRGTSHIQRSTSTNQRVGRGSSPWVGRGSSARVGGILRGLGVGGILCGQGLGGILGGLRVGGITCGPAVGWLGRWPGGRVGSVLDGWVGRESDGRAGREVVGRAGRP